MEKNKKSFKKKYSRIPNFIHQLHLSMFQKNNYHDLILKAKNNKEFYVYSSILGSRFEQLKSFIEKEIESQREKRETKKRTEEEDKTSKHRKQKREKENEDILVIKLDYEPYVIESIIHYIYTSEFRFPIRDPDNLSADPFNLACQLYEISSEWVMDEAQEIYAEYIIAEIERNQFLNKSSENKDPIKNFALKKWEEIKRIDGKFNQDRLSRKVLHLIDRDIQKIFMNKDLLHLKDNIDLTPILRRDTLNITSERIIDEITFEFEKKWSKSQFDHSGEKYKKEIKSNFVPVIRFGTLDIEDLETLYTYKLLDENEKKDIENFIKAKSQTEKKIIAEKKEYENHDWFKNKRCYFDQRFILSAVKEPSLKKESLNLDEKKSLIFEKCKEAWKQVDKDNVIEKLKLQFVSSKDHNLNCRDFHLICDNKGPTLVVIESENTVFGGYTSVGWKKLQSKKKEYKYENQIIELNDQLSYIEDDKAFLFVLNSRKDQFNHRFDVIKDEKHTSVIYFSEFGPIFGSGWDLSISSNLQTGFLNPGFTYQLPGNILSGSNEARSFFTSNNKFSIQRLEVYFA